MHKFVSALAVMITALSLAGCGGEKSPTSPSSTGAGTPSAGGNTAVISGSIRAGSPLLSASTGAAASALTVTVVGTSISSGIDASDHFTLSGVPAGEVDLKFSGGGVDSTVHLSPVLPAQTVTLVVNVAGAAVVVDSEVRSTSSSGELEGRVESLPPT